MADRRPLAVNDLLFALREATVVGTLPGAVSGIAADSRTVQPGEAFVAVPGLRQDARRFVSEAVERGATVVVVEGAPLPGLSVAQLLVPSARLALARAAAAYYRHPSRMMTLVGITGTNGKTTTSYLVEALLHARGLSPGVIGTIEYRFGAQVMPAGQTTPEALEIEAILAGMHAAGVRGVAMEVSSHALALNRVDELTFDVAVFTNLTQDHLDFHRTLDGYRRAKRRLFELLDASPKPGRTAVVNGDDPSGAEMVRGLGVPVLTFGFGPEASLRVVDHASALDGIRLTAATPRGRIEVRSPLIGEHNVMNLLGAAGVGLALGLDPAAVSGALGGVAAVPGRFEQVRAGQPFLVVVDYAHTPDALERVLATARKLTPGRLAVVFGCGGDRDRTKRPIMGDIAARLGDRVWITSDNPRSEPPEAIIDEILVGVRRSGVPDDRWVRQADRRRAIAEAVGWARAGDAVVIAGKGHETYQIVGAEVLSFDDREVARQALAGRAAEPMTAFTVQEIVRATQGALVVGDLGVGVAGAGIDSRTVGVGEAFFAIRGHRLDGHAFVGEAASRGAACLVVHSLPDPIPAGVPLVLVDDTTRALGRLAAAHRARFQIPVVAVTGSNGKTTTKEMIAAVLATRWRVLKPESSFNNQWGLPLTLLRLAPEHEALVVEIGTNQRGEIAALAALAAPTVGVVTTVAAVHTEFLGSLDGVAEEKAALVRALPPDGRAVLNADDPRVAAMARQTPARVLTYGRAPDAAVRALDDAREDGDGLGFTLEAGGARVAVRLAFAGRHNVVNALAAAAAGVALGVAPAEIARGLGQARPVKGRCVWRPAGAARLLDDTYNANPDSVRAALATAAAHRGGRRLVVVLGDMLELGEATEAAHREAGRRVAEAGAAEFIGMGRHAALAVEAARAAGLAEAQHTTSFEETVAHLLKRVAPGDLVLVKGSRGMRMERVADALVARLGRAAGT